MLGTSQMLCSLFPATLSQQPVECLKEVSSVMERPNSFCEAHSIIVSVYILHPML